MPGLNYYVRLPGYDFPDKGWDVSGLSNALTEFNRSRDAAAQREQNQQRIDMERERLGMAREQQDQETAEKLKRQVGGIAQFIDSLPEDDPRRQQYWKRLIDTHPDFGATLAKHGSDPEDYVSGPKFLLAQIEGPQDLTKKRLMEAQADYYSQRGEAMTQNAETRRLKMFKDIVDRYGGKVPPQDVWERDNQPGGFMYAVLGRSIPYSEAPMVLAQAQRGGAADEFEPTERERILGITRQQKIDAAINEELVKTYGPPKRGYQWMRNADGTVSQVLKAAPVKPTDPNAKRSAQFHAATIKKALDVLQDTGPGLLGYINRGVQGYFDTYAIGQAFHDYEQGILGLVYAKSGQQSAVKEMEMWLKAYGPRPGDSAWRVKEKTKRLIDYMKAQFDINLEDEIGATAGKKGGDAGWKIEKVQ